MGHNQRGALDGFEEGIYPHHTVMIGFTACGPPFVMASLAVRIIWLAAQFGEGLALPDTKAKFAHPRFSCHPIKITRLGGADDFHCVLGALLRRDNEVKSLKFFALV